MKNRTFLLIAVTALTTLPSRSCAGELDASQQQAIEAARKERATVKIGPPPNFFLSIQYESADDGDPFFDLLPKLSNLRKLHLVGFGLSRVDACPQLESLVCDGGIGRDWLIPLESLSNLKSLAIEQHGDHPDIFLGDLADVPSLQSLESLSISIHSMTADECAMLAKLPNLRSIEISRSVLHDKNLPGAITDEAISALAQNRKLRRISISPAGSITLNGLRSLAGLPELESLTLYCSYSDTSFGNSELRTVAESKQLKSLTLFACREITPDGFQPLSQLPELEELILGGCRIGNGGIKHLAGLRKLKRFESYDSGVTDDDFALLGDLTSLEKLAIDGDLSNISDAGVRHLADLKNLVHLRLGSMPHVASGLREFHRMTKLEHFQISAKSATSDDLRALQTMPELRSVNLNHRARLCDRP